MNAPPRSNAFTGLLLGTAVGDSLGLPFEGLSAQRGRRWRRGPWRQTLFFGRGMVSDDTEHALFVAQALLAEPCDARRFARLLAWKLRGWLLALPAGVGLATARAIFKLWMGFAPEKSGVWSAGNGPAMRSAVLGAYFADEPEQLAAFVAASTGLTHRDPRALVGALAVAHAAAWAVRTSGPDSARDVAPLFACWRALSGKDDAQEWPRLLAKLEAGWRENCSVAEFARRLGLEKGVSGYIYHTVPVALFAWLRHRGDGFAQTLAAALECGGDADTVGAIAGALAGVIAGKEGIPPEWRERIFDWPRSPRLLAAVASRLAEQRQAHPPRSLGPVPYCWPAVPLRNLLFLGIVLCHGLRRLAPPY